MVSESVTLMWLFFTAPCFNAVLSDSGAIICNAQGDSLRDLGSIYVYRQLITGGPSVLHQSKSLRSKECQPESIEVDASSGAHFYALFSDLDGNLSCPSNRIYVGPITGVEDPVMPDRVVRTTYYDVRGRRVRQLTTQGIYWRVTDYASGRREKKRIVHLK